MIWFILIAFGWYAFGAFSHVRWWTKKHDYTTGDLFVTVLSAFLGPFNWWIGWMVCGDGPHGPERVLLPRRSPQENASE